MTPEGNKHLLFTLRNGEQYGKTISADQWNREGVTPYGSYGWVQIPWQNHEGQTWIRCSEIVEVQVSENLEMILDVSP